MSSMEALKTRLKIIAWFLATLILFQSCVVYHKTPMTLQEASKERLRTKVKTSYHKDYKFSYIIVEDGVYYGVTDKFNMVNKTPLYEDKVLEIVQENKSASAWTSLATFVGVPVLVISIGVIAMAEDW